MTQQHFAGKSVQRGAVLLIGMVMLMMLTLIAVGVIRLSMSHTQIVNNEQVRTEATAAANYALDMMVLNTPASNWAAADNDVYINLGTSSDVDTVESSIKVTVKKPTCRRQRIIQNSELVKTKDGTSYVPDVDSTCFGSGGSPLTIVDPALLGAVKGDSLCATVLYEVEATANDAKLLNATATVIQGVEVRRGIDQLGAAGTCS